VTPYLGRRGWLRRLDHRTVLVRELKPTILMSAEDYNPPVTSRGEHILKFASRSGESVILLCNSKPHTNDSIRCRRVPGCNGGGGIDDLSQRGVGKDRPH
jgi:hypothetical protein